MCHFCAECVACCVILWCIICVCLLWLAAVSVIQMISVFRKWTRWLATESSCSCDVLIHCGSWWFCDCLHYHLIYQHQKKLLSSFVLWSLTVFCAWPVLLPAGNEIVHLSLVSECTRQLSSVSVYNWPDASFNPHWGTRPNLLYGNCVL